MLKLYEEEIKRLHEEHNHYSFVESQLRQELLIEQADFMKFRCEEILLAIDAMERRNDAIKNEIDSMTRADRTMIVSLLHEQLILVAEIARSIGCSHLAEYIRVIADRILEVYLQ